MSHSGPFRCQCGQIHADRYDGPSNDLLPFIDSPGISALNESEAGACRRIFKPYDKRLERDTWLDSDDEDPQLIIHIPFTSPVKIQSITVIGGPDGTAPRDLRAFINHEALDFADAEDAVPVQAWELADGDAAGLLEYPTQFSKFQNVSKLSLFISSNHGAEATRIYYLGLKGVGTEHQRRAVEAVYEVRAVKQDTDIKDTLQAGQSFM